MDKMDEYVNYAIYSMPYAVETSVSDVSTLKSLALIQDMTMYQDRYKEYSTAN